MPLVTIIPHETICPQGATVTVPTGQKLALALAKAGINIPHACGYNCACATCHIIVRAGGDSLEEPDDNELDQLDTVPTAGSLSRLSCQTRMGERDITIEIPGSRINPV